MNVLALSQENNVNTEKMPLLREECRVSIGKAIFRQHLLLDARWIVDARRPLCNVLDARPMLSVFSGRACRQWSYSLCGHPNRVLWLNCSSVSNQNVPLRVSFGG